MASLYFILYEKLRLNPIASKAIYISQSLLNKFETAFSSKVKDAAMSPSAPDGVALCVRIRDEALNLKEFIEYYLAAGISHFFFYEARSTDNFHAVLDPFISEGVVTLIDNWPHVPISPAAEHDCILRCIGRFAWMGCLDADEFVVVRDNLSIPDYLYGIPKRSPAAALHWKMYGSSGHLKRPQLPVILAYPRRARVPDLHVKVFLRPDRVRYCRNSHSWYYRGLFSAAVDENGRCVWGSASLPATAEKAWINHYYHKSHEEFTSKGRRASVLDRSGIQFNSRTAERGANFESAANEVWDLAAVDYHKTRCTRKDCSICSAISATNAPSTDRNFTVTNG
jgi:hypothetical protein